MGHSKAGNGWVHDRGVFLSASPLAALGCVLAGLCLPATGYAQTIRRHREPVPPPVVQSEAQPDEQPAAPVAAPAPPVPPTLEHTPSRLPTVTLQHGALTIVAYNSTLRDILEAVQSQTGAMIDIPGDANERVIVRLGPGPVRKVLDSLLNGSAYNYVMLASAADPDALAKIVLTAKPSEEKAPVKNPSPFVANRRQPASEPASAGATATPAPVAEVAAHAVSKQENAASQDSSAKAETPETADSDTASPAANGANAAADAYPRTPNIRTAQEVLQDLYARRRQSMEQQNQPPQTPP